MSLLSSDVTLNSLSGCETLKQMVKPGWSRSSGPTPRSTVISVDPYGVSFYLYDWDLGQLWPEGQNSRLVTYRTSWRNEWAAVFPPSAATVPAECPRARHWTLNRPSVNCSVRRDDFWDGRCCWDKTFLSRAHFKMKLPCQTLTKWIYKVNHNLVERRGASWCSKSPLQYDIVIKEIRKPHFPLPVLSDTSSAS